MARTSSALIYAYRGLFVLLIAVILFASLLPTATGERLPGPDLIVATVFAWLLRRPDYVPVLVLAVVFLIADVLFLRPLGLWAAILVVATEFVRRREPSFRETSFLAEWGFVASVLTVAFTANALILAFFGVAQPAFGLTLLQLIFTALSYPLVALISSLALGVKKLTPIQTDRMGRSR